MSKTVSERLGSIIGNYTNGIVPNQDYDLMAKPISLQAYDMAALFIDIEKEFSIDLNKLVPSLDVYSPKSIADKINILIE